MPSSVADRPPGQRIDDRIRALAADQIQGVPAVVRFRLKQHFLNPELTTVDIRVREIVHTAVEMLTQAIEKPNSPPMRSVTIKPELLIRKST